jgi:hypothetical protein
MFDSLDHINPVMTHRSKETVIELRRIIVGTISASSQDTIEKELDHTILRTTGYTMTQGSVEKDELTLKPDLPESVLLISQFLESNLSARNSQL